MLSNLEIADQTILAYIRTRECVELSNRLGYSLSFTGYSFGAWLAEQSVFFCHKDFKKRDVRAVTFESPGSKEYLEDILNTSNIYSRETNFDLIDLDIVTYLTEPNFLNTCNSHVGKVYRFYLKSEKEEENEEKETIHFMEKEVIDVIEDVTVKKMIKDWFKSKVKSYLKPYLFYLNGLKSLFSNGLASILRQFDEAQERPGKYHRVLKWPKVSFTPSQSMKDNYLNLIDFDALIDMVPGGELMPKMIKNKLTSLANSGAQQAVGFVVNRCLAGVACILNLILEVFKGTMNHEQCLKCYEENEKMLKYEKLHDKESELSLDFQKDMFSLSFQGMYQVEKVDLSSEERRILPNTTLYYMLKLYNRVELVLKNQAKLSNPTLEKYLIDLSSLYEIRSLGSGVDNSSLFTIRTLEEGLELERLKWFMYKLIYDDSKLEIKNYLDSLSVGGGGGAAAISLRLVQDLAHRVVPFIGRTQILEQIDEQMQSKQIVILAAFGGTGKTALANEFGYRYCEQSANANDRVSILLHCETAEKIYDDLKKMALHFKIDIANKEIAANLFFHVRAELNELDQSFLFILDNVDKYEDIDAFLKEFCQLKSEKCKFLLTTRDKSILENRHFQHDQKCLFAIDSFSEEEASNFIQKYLKINLTESQTEMVKSAVKFANKILPLKLKLTVNYINENFLDFSSLKECVDFIRTQSTAIKEVEVETYLFKALSKSKSLRILAFCSYLDADAISLNLMRDLFKPLKEALGKLISLGMLDVDYKTSKIKMHRLVQSEMRSFIRNNPNEFLMDETKDEKKILMHLIKHLNSSLTFGSSVTNNGSELSEKIELEYAQAKSLINFIDLNLDEEESKINFKQEFQLNVEYLKLKEKLAYYYFYFDVSNQYKALDIFQFVNNSLSEIHKNNENNEDLARSFFVIGLINYYI